MQSTSEMSKHELKIMLAKEHVRLMPPEAAKVQGQNRCHENNMGQRKPIKKAYPTFLRRPYDMNLRYVEAKAYGESSQIFHHTSYVVANCEMLQCPFSPNHQTLSFLRLSTNFSNNAIRSPKRITNRTCPATFCIPKS